MEYELDFRDVVTVDAAHDIIKEVFELDDDYSASKEGLTEVVNVLSDDTTVVIYLNEDANNEIDDIVKIFAEADNINLILE